MQKVPALQRFPALAANAIDAATTSSQVVGGAKTAAAGLRVGEFGNEKIFTINGGKAPSPRPKRSLLDESRRADSDRCAARPLRSSGGRNGEALALLAGRDEAKTVAAGAV